MLLTNDCLPYFTVYYYFRQWKRDGMWKQVHDHIVEWVRIVDGFTRTPSAGALDCESVPSAVMIAEPMGDDGGKRIKRRKRFTLVDTLGLLIAVKVVAASVPERDGASGSQRLPRLTRIWVDGGFSEVDFLKTIVDVFGLILEVMLRSQDAQGFVAQMLGRGTDLWLAALMSAAQCR